MKPIKVVTRRGDDGTTDTPDGDRVYKKSHNIVACGKLDTLHAQMGVANAYMNTFGHDKEWETIYKGIVEVLYLIMGEVASESSQVYREKYPYLDLKHLDLLEDLITIVGETLDGQGVELAGWVVYGTSNLIGAHLDLASKLCREAETCTALYMADTRPIIKQYINRLSDYLFLLARSYEN